MVVEGVDVAFGGVGARVAKHKLHLEEGGAAALEVGAEGVAERVGVKIAEAGAAENAAEVVAEVVGFGGDGGEGRPDIISDFVFF